MSPISGTMKERLQAFAYRHIDLNELRLRGDLLLLLGFGLGILLLE